MGAIAARHQNAIGLHFDHYFTQLAKLLVAYFNRAYLRSDNNPILLKDIAIESENEQIITITLLPDIADIIFFRPDLALQELVDPELLTVMRKAHKDGSISLTITGEQAAEIVRHKCASTEFETLLLTTCMSSQLTHYLCLSDDALTVAITGENLEIHMDQAISANMRSDIYEALLSINYR